jgi:hypothetical protein
VGWAEATGELLVGPGLVTVGPVNFLQMARTVQEVTDLGIAIVTREPSPFPSRGIPIH